MTEGALLGPEEIYLRIRTEILNGDLRPGETMSQVALAGSIGVHRSPLREALRLLQAEGLIQAEPGRQVRVTPLTATDLEELWIARITLEAQAMRLSLPLLSPEDIAALEGEVAVMDHFARNRDFDRWSVPHRQFHRRLTHAAGARIDALLGQLFDHADRYHRLHFGAGPGPQVTISHRDILNACVNRDRDLAARLLVRHIAQPAFELAEIIEPDRPLLQLRTAVADLTGDEIGPGSDAVLTRE